MEERGGRVVKNIEDSGYGKGIVYQFEKNSSAGARVTGPMNDTIETKTGFGTKHGLRSQTWTRI
jgi:hypothetical protein